MIALPLIPAWIGVGRWCEAPPLSEPLRTDTHRRDPARGTFVVFGDTQQSPILD